MKKTMKFLAVLCLLCLLSSAAAEGCLSGKLEGNMLRVAWPSVSGECTLTVYRDGWPELVLSVRGEDCSANLSLGDPTGTITLRLQTPQGCMAADVAGAKAADSKPEKAGEASEKTGAKKKRSKKARQTKREKQAKPAVTVTPAPTKRPEKTKRPEPTERPAPAATPRPTQSASGSTRPGLAAQVIAQVNAEREKQGLGPVREDAELNRAAAVRARELTESFSHTRPDGSSWSTVSASALGENIAKGQQTADKVMAAWMTSSGHRENILRPGYGSIGVCAYVYGGVTYWVQLFGR